MELIKKLREANTMMWFGAKIDLSEMINELEVYIIAQDNIINGIQNLAQRRTDISQRKSFIKYLSLRHKCTRREIINMNCIQ
jgi:uncharacterized coiled-coil protein SlyX